MGKRKSVHPPMDGTVIKRCYKCERDQPASEFYPNHLLIGGRSNRCKKCDAIYALSQYYKHRDKRISGMKEWKKKNGWNNKYYHRRSSDPEQKFIRCQRSRLHQVLKGIRKVGVLHDFIGCTPRQAIYHLTDGGYEIPKGMHIDHYIPISFFNLRNPNELKVCFNWRNLQLLTASQNIKKNDSLPHDYRERLNYICSALGVTIDLHVR